jgi:hypothetical protein
MTPEEIKSTATLDGTKTVIGIADICFWLKEISFQLAILNKREESHDTGDGCLAIKIHNP